MTANKLFGAKYSDLKAIFANRAESRRAVGRNWGIHRASGAVARPKTSDPLHRRKIGGLGLFFMYKMMDGIDFSFSKDRGNVLTMVKKIQK